MSFLDFNNKVNFDPKTLVEEGLSIFDFQSQCVELGIYDNELIICFDEFSNIDFETRLSKKEVKDLINSLTELHKSMED
jgi:hypothetical protein